MPNKNFSVSAWCDMCSLDTSLHLHDLQLLHEEVADASQIDALKGEDIRLCAIRNKKINKGDNNEDECEEFTHIFTRTYTLIS